MSWIVVAAVAATALVAITAVALLVGPFLLLNAHQAAEATVDQAPTAHALLAELAPAARIARPRLFVIPTSTPNGLAVTTSREGIVAVTEGVLETLDGPQLRGVLALLVAAIARPRARLETALAVLALVFAPLFLPSVAIVRFGLRGDRWYEVDRSAATLVGGDVIVAALNRLESERTARPDFGGPTGAGLFCVTPGFPKKWSDRTLANQPPTETRLARLRKQSQAGPAPGVTETPGTSRS